MKVSIPATIALRLRSLTLTLCSLYRSKTISMRWQVFPSHLNVFQRFTKKSRYVLRFCFLTGTSFTYPMKSKIKTLLLSDGERDVGSTPRRRFLSSMARSDFLGFQYASNKITLVKFQIWGEFWGQNSVIVYSQCCAKIWWSLCWHHKQGMLRISFSFRSSHFWYGIRQFRCLFFKMWFVELIPCSFA